MNLASRPLAVLPLLGQVEVSRREDLVLLALELWSDAFVIRFASYDHGPGIDIKAVWNARDDLGNEYDWSATGHRKLGNGVRTGEWRFAPALQPGVRHLHFACRQDDLAMIAEFEFDIPETE